MLFVALLIAAVCATQFTFDLADKNNAGTKILAEEATLELLYQRNHKKVFAGDYIKNANEAFTPHLTLDVKLTDTVENVKKIADVVHAKAPTATDSDANKKATTTLFTDAKFDSPADDFNCRIAETARLCDLQATHFHSTFAKSFKKANWATIEKFNAVKTFKTAIGATDETWKTIITKDVPDDLLQKYAQEGCKLEEFRNKLFKDHDAHKNSVAAFGLSAILAAAALAF